MSRTDTDIPGHVRSCPGTAKRGNGGGRTRTSPFKGCPYVRPPAMPGHHPPESAGPSHRGAVGGTLSRFISIRAVK